MVYRFSQNGPTGRDALALNHLWQATLFFVIALLASLLLRGGPARARYLPLWLAASIKFAVPSAIVILALSGAGIRVQSIFDWSGKSAPTLNYLSPVVSPVVIPARYGQAAEPLQSAKALPMSRARQSVEVS